MRRENEKLLREGGDTEPHQAEIQPPDLVTREPGQTLAGLAYKVVGGVGALSLRRSSSPSLPSPLPPPFLNSLSAQKPVGRLDSGCTENVYNALHGACALVRVQGLHQKCTVAASAIERKEMHHRPNGDYEYGHITRRRLPTMVKGPGPGRWEGGRPVQPRSADKAMATRAVPHHTAPMVHQTSYRPAYNPQTTRQVSYNCCPGWSQISKISHGCGRPLCSSSCQNGGSCVRPDSCSCAKGFTGSSCQTAVCSGSCQNGGSCVGPDSCECPTGYTGPTCQTGELNIILGKVFVYPLRWSLSQYTGTADDGEIGVRIPLVLMMSVHDFVAAVCSSPCMNGGRCIGPELCACPSGFTGQYCQTDIDECESKPCDQQCVNLPGSFECQCKTGFTLLEDGTSCRNCQDQFPTEARDLVDVEILAKRVQKLEEKRLRRGEILRVSSEGDNTVMGSGAGSNEMALEEETSGTLAELGRKMETFSQLIQDLKTQLTNVETRQQEQWKLIQKTKNSETIVRRVVPLCKQVSMMQQRMDQFLPPGECQYFKVLSTDGIIPLESHIIQLTTKMVHVEILSAVILNVMRQRLSKSIKKQCVLQTVVYTDTTDLLCAQHNIFGRLLLWVAILS
uniref:EGF-like domain-containing protein n=1 Tax=Timema genevievae TaxID=629358 RepID=A0A7R9K3M5_TIMGE|nr:unnamed protein product [Timema genevievae]